MKLEDVFSLLVSDWSEEGHPYSGRITCYISFNLEVGKGQFHGKINLAKIIKDIILIIIKMGLHLLKLNWNTLNKWKMISVKKLKSHYVNKKDCANGDRGAN